MMLTEIALLFSAITAITALILSAKYFARMLARVEESLAQREILQPIRREEEQRPASYRLRVIHPPPDLRKTSTPEEEKKATVHYGEV